MIRTNSQRAGGRYYTRYISNYAKKNYALLMLGALFLTGVLLGTLLISFAQNDTLELLLRVVNGFIEKRREQSFFQNFLSTCASSIFFAAAMFVCGFCAISQPVIVLAPLFRGLGFGFSVASLYASHGTGAAGFVALFMMPDMLLSTIAILLCCRESLRLSRSFFGVMLNNSGSADEFYSLRIYLGRYTAAAVLCFISAFIEAVLYFGFAKYFILG